jgi:hypothetical protein
MKPVKDLSDEELVLELSEKIRKKRKLESELKDLDRVKATHERALGLNIARKTDLDNEMVKRGNGKGK